MISRGFLWSATDTELCSCSRDRAVQNVVAQGSLDRSAKAGGVMANTGRLAVPVFGDAARHGCPAAAAALIAYWSSSLRFSRSNSSCEIAPASRSFLRHMILSYGSSRAVLGVAAADLSVHTKMISMRGKLPRI